MQQTLRDVMCVTLVTSIYGIQPSAFKLALQGIS